MGIILVLSLLQDSIFIPAPHGRCVPLYWEPNSSDRSTGLAPAGTLEPDAGAGAVAGAVAPGAATGGPGRYRGCAGMPG